MKDDPKMSGFTNISKVKSQVAQCEYAIFILTNPDCVLFSSATLKLRSTLELNWETRLAEVRATRPFESELKLDAEVRALASKS
jgi:hypothetical protein